VRRPLGRPGAGPVQPAASVAAAEPVSALASAARETTFEDAAATHARAHVVLEQAEAQRREWEAQAASAHAELEAEREALQHREQALHEARLAHEEALQGSHEAAAQRGYEEGLARGIAEGRAGADAAAAGRLEQLDALARAIADASASALAQQEDMLVEVVWTAICRLAGELALSRDGALAMVRTAADQVRETQGLRIRLHPQDAEWLAQRAEAASWSLLADPAVALGGCMVESAQGTLDARLELQLERLRNALRETRALRAAGTAGA
jgi:flagellar assembly protein FliH